MTAESEAPRWDLASIYPSLDSEEFRQDTDRHESLLRELEELFDRSSIHGRDNCGEPAEDALLLCDLLRQRNRLTECGRRIRTFVSCLTTTDATNAAAQAWISLLARRWARVRPLEVRFAAWLAPCEIDALIAVEPDLSQYSHLLRQAVAAAKRQMSQPEEELAAELHTAGAAAWARLHDDMTALLTVRFEHEGDRLEMPMAALRGLATDPLRSLREAAYHAELESWKRVEVPLAAAMNGIKGSQSILNRRREWGDDVAPSLLQNSIDAKSLDAMQGVCRESFPLFRRYLRARARALGIPRVAWYDLAAPLGSSPRRWSWSDGQAFVLEQFGSFSARMKGLAERSFRERWIDVPPAEGKVGGAYCAGLGSGKSRILMNWDNSFNSVSTLAHELGHAYHNLNLAGRPPLAARTPSTLAETSSIFCETICTEAALRGAAGEERLTLLDVSLQRDLLVIVDIHSRFLFEKRVLQRRAERELSPDELCEMMLQAQDETYGDGLDPNRRHRYMWAVKPHYYGPLFYNYPYTFGLLLGLGLYEQYREDPERFQTGYDSFLSATGMAGAAELAGTWGFDIRSRGFWEASLRLIERNVHRFEQLVESDSGR